MTVITRSQSTIDFTIIRRASRPPTSPSDPVRYRVRGHLIHVRPIRFRRARPIFEVIDLADLKDWTRIRPTRAAGPAGENTAWAAQAFAQLTGILPRERRSR